MLPCRLGAHTHSLNVQATAQRPVRLPSPSCNTQRYSDPTLEATFPGEEHKANQCLGRKVCESGASAMRLADQWAAIGMKREGKIEKKKKGNRRKPRRQLCAPSILRIGE
jgi:hypothetical protein